MNDFDTDSTGLFDFESEVLDLMRLSEYINRDVSRTLKVQEEIAMPRSPEYIIASEHKRTGEMSIAPKPKLHTSKVGADAEAERLASLHTEKKFVVLQVKGKASVSNIVWE